MAEQRAERRLAAILAGDIAGYSRLMGADEEGTLSRLNAHRREFLEPKIADHRGRIVKRTGDGILIEFASAVDAARCAVEIQRGMAERNTSVPQDERIEFRIASGVPRLDCPLGSVGRQHFSCGERCKVGALASAGCWGFWFSPRSNSSLGLRWLVVRLVGGQSIGCSQASGWGRAGEDAGRGSAVVPWKEPLAGHRLA
jgi:hypothetical protein